MRITTAVEELVRQDILYLCAIAGEHTKKELSFISHRGISHLFVSG